MKYKFALTIQDKEIKRYKKPSEVIEDLFYLQEEKLCKFVRVKRLERE